MDSATRQTIDYLNLCRKAKAAGMQVSYATSATWLVNVAINRRADWPDDPSFTRGSCMPVNGKYPSKASGDYYGSLCRLRCEINTPRLIVRERNMGECRKLLMARIPHRITTAADEQEW